MASALDAIIETTFLRTVRNKILNIIFVRYSSRLALEKANAEARYFFSEKANFMQNIA